jgi:SAM-dependent methyltransferase
VPNAEFASGDLQVTGFEREFDYAFSRMGTMFFANPVPAMRNVREALVPGGRLCMVVWRRKLENEWVRRSEEVVERFVEEPERSDEPTCGPGPFSMADADTTSEIMVHAGFRDIAFHRCDIPILIGRDVEEAVDLVTALGPAGEILRLAGERAAHLHGAVHEALREGLREYARPDGVWGPASTWIVTATAPQEPVAAG